MINVTCAIFIDGDKILATKRSDNMHLAGKWEFPGGKIEKDETTQECIIREIYEELGIVAKPIIRLIAVKHIYPEKSIQLIPFLCTIESGDICLREHAEYKWISKLKIHSLDWAEADKKLIAINKLG